MLVCRTDVEGVCVEEGDAAALGGLRLGAARLVGTQEALRKEARSTKRKKKKRTHTACHVSALRTATHAGSTQEGRVR
jgi:hypothetical protein